MDMNNMFENAYFGKAYKTRDGRKAVYNSTGSKVEENGDHLFIIENRYSYYHYDNFGRYYHNDINLDIVSEWQEEINEEELDKLAELFTPFELITRYNLSISKKQVDILVECFKAGYRAAKQK